MTNLNAVKIGMNKFCGPAVLSILTGKSTDECASVISRINGHYKVEGVQLPDLLKAADKLGFTNTKIEPAATLFGTLTRLASDEGMYIVTVTGHFVAIEVKEGKIYFCDNHTKEPMPAASSARMMQRCLAVNKVFRKPEPKLLQEWTKIEVHISKQFIYDDPDLNRSQRICGQVFDNAEQAEEFIRRNAK